MLLDPITHYTQRPLSPAILTVHGDHLRVIAGHVGMAAAQLARLAICSAVLAQAPGFCAHCGSQQHPLGPSITPIPCACVSSARRETAQNLWLPLAPNMVF